MNGTRSALTKRLDGTTTASLSTLYLCFGLRPMRRILSDYAVKLFDSQLHSELQPIVRVGAEHTGC